MRRMVIPLVLLIWSGCQFSTALLGPQQLVRVDDGLKESLTFHKRVFSIPEPRYISKIVIQGHGEVKNIEIYIKTSDEPYQSFLTEKIQFDGRTIYRGDCNATWEPLKKIRRMVKLPLEIPVGRRTDAIYILQNTITGRGVLETVEFYGTGD